MTNERIKELMEALGFDFAGGTGREPRGDSPEEFNRFAALEQLIAGAIIDWAALTHDIRPEEDPQDAVMEWAEEWLVG